MNTKKITLRLNLDKENDRMAWEILRSHKGQSYTETVVNALVRKDWAEVIAEKNLENLKLQTLTEEKPIDEIEQAQSYEAALDFLDSLWISVSITKY